MRGRLGLALAAACAAAAVPAVGLGVDALRWDDALRSSDVAFRSAPGRPGLWEAEQTFPFGAARGLLGLDDDLAYRRGQQLVRLARPRYYALGDHRVQLLRGEARQPLVEIARGDGDALRRARAANLLGILSLSSAAEDDRNAEAHLTVAARLFREAIELDPAFEDAKHNLELTFANAERQAKEDRERRRRGRGDAEGGEQAQRGSTGGGY